MLPPICRSVRSRVKIPRGIERREPESQQGMRTGAADDVLEAVLVHDLCEGQF